MSTTRFILSLFLILFTSTIFAEDPVPISEPIPVVDEQPVPEPVPTEVPQPVAEQPVPEPVPTEIPQPVAEQPVPEPVPTEAPQPVNEQPVPEPVLEPQPIAEEPTSQPTTSEDNDAPQGAATLTIFGHKKTDSLYAVNDLDFYRLQLRRTQGNLTLSFSHENIGLNPNIGWRIDLLSSNDLAKVIHSMTLVESSLTAKSTIGLAEGIYYIRVSSMNPDVAPVGEPYEITTKLEESEFFEQTPNELPSESTLVKLDNLYTGNLSMPSDTDYYNVGLTQDDTITFRLRQETSVNINNEIGWLLEVFSENNLNDSLATLHLPETNAMNETAIALPVGVYYIRVTSLNPNEVPNANYQLQALSSLPEGSVEPLVCKEVKVYGQNPVTGHWAVFPSPCAIPIGWYSQLHQPASVTRLYSTEPFTHATFIPETSQVNIPLLDIKNAEGYTEVWNVTLQLLQVEPTIQLQVVDIAPSN